MVTLRPTARLAKRMRRNYTTDLGCRPSTRLGDWHAQLIHGGTFQVILAVSDRTLLPVLLPARAATTLDAALPLALSELLDRLSIPRWIIDAELHEMKDVSITKPNDWSVLGTIRDFQRSLPHVLGRALTLTDAAQNLAATPCGPIDMQFPCEVAQEVLLTK